MNTDDDNDNDDDDFDDIDMRYMFVEMVNDPAQRDENLDENDAQQINVHQIGNLDGKTIMSAQ